MIKKRLPIFSYLFHPIFIPIMVCLLFFYNSDSGLVYNKLEVYLVLFQVIVLTFILPISFFYFLKSIGKIDTIMISDLSQRKIPFLIQLILLIVLIINGTTLNKFPELFYFFLGGVLSTITVIFLVFFKIKASIHQLAITSFLFFVVGLSIHNQENMINTIIFLVFVTGLVAASRLAMKAHTNLELIIGLIIGMITQIGLWKYWV